MLKQNIKHYLIIYGGQDLSLKDFIYSIVNKQMCLDLNLSELIEMVKGDQTIWKFNESSKQEKGKKETNYNSLTENRAAK